MDGVYKVVTCESGRPLYKRDTRDKAGQALMTSNPYSHVVLPHQEPQVQPVLATQRLL